jgi:hypothetical protein
MGETFVVTSLEQMCALMCDNVIPEQEESEEEDDDDK